MQRIPYFCAWPMREIKEINIHAQIKPYQVDQVVLGNREKFDVPEHVFFVVKGRCTIVRRIAMIETSKVVGNHGSTKRVIKYKRLASNRVKQLVGQVEGNGVEALDKLNQILRNSTKLDQKGHESMHSNTIYNSRTATRQTVHKLEHGYRKAMEPFASQLRLLDHDVENIKYNGGVLPQLTRNKGRFSHNAVRSTKTPVRHGFKANIGRMSVIDESGKRVSTNKKKQQAREDCSENKVIFKHLVVGKLEIGDSFGYGEDLRNIFIVTAAPTEFLTIPGHIMMRAERHIETFGSKSTMQNFGRLNNVKEAANAPEKTCVEKNKAMQKRLPPGTSKRTHPYEELRHIMEERIPNERECFDRWRQSEDWSAYKSSVLEDVINDRQKP